MGRPRTGTRNGEAQPYTVVNNGRVVWRHQVSLGKNAEGKRITATGTGKTPNEAMRRAALNAEKKQQRGLNTPTRRGRGRRGKNFYEMTLEEYGRYWHERLNPDRYTAQVKHNYIRSLELHVFPELGNVLLHEITKQDIEDLFRLTLPAKTTKGGKPLLGKSAMKNIFTPLSLMFQRAEEDDEIISRSPVLAKYGVNKSEIEEPEDVKTVPEKKHLALWMMERERRGQAGGGDAFTYLWLRLNFYGIRQGERNALSWSDINNITKRNGATLSITKQMVSEKGKGNYIKHKLKTKDSKRTFPIDEDLRLALIEWRKEQAQQATSTEWEPWEGDDYENLILTRSNGQPLTQKVDTNLWNSYRLRVLAPDSPHLEWRQHLNRHITASLFHLWGLSIEEAKRILGHSDTEMTRYYTAMSHSTLRQPIATFGRMITMSAAERKKMERRQNAEINAALYE